MGGVAVVDAGDALATVNAATLGPAGYVTRAALDEVAPETRRHAMRRTSKPHRNTKVRAKDVKYDTENDLDAELQPHTCAICLSALARRARRRQLPCSHIYHSDVSALLIAWVIYVLFLCLSHSFPAGLLVLAVCSLAALNLPLIVLAADIFSSLVVVAEI